MSHSPVGIPAKAPDTSEGPTLDSPAHLGPQVTAAPLHIIGCPRTASLSPVNPRNCEQSYLLLFVCVILIILRLSFGGGLLFSNNKPKRDLSWPQRPAFFCLKVSKPRQLNSPSRAARGIRLQSGLHLKSHSCWSFSPSLSRSIHSLLASPGAFLQQITGT